MFSPASSQLKCTTKGQFDVFLHLTGKNCSLTFSNKIFTNKTVVFIPIRTRQPPRPCFPILLCGSHKNNKKFSKEFHFYQNEYFHKFELNFVVFNSTTRTMAIGKSARFGKSTIALIHIV